VSELSPTAHPGPPRFDLFVSYASDDRAPVQQLVAALEARHVTVWWDQGQITLGDSLSLKINEGLNNSRYGLVVISESSIAENWPANELRHLLGRSTDSGEKVILPVRLGISHKRLSEQFPSLADVVTTEFGTNLDVLVDKILITIKWTGPDTPSPNEPQPTPAPPQQENPEDSDTSPHGTDQPDTTQRHVVFLLPGIRTHAEWATRAAATLETHPSISSARWIGYEYFELTRFLLPWHSLRQKPVQRVKRLIRDELSRESTVLSVVAHSFGTYIIGRILNTEPDIKIHRLIMCGSVLPDNFDWTRICQSQQLSADSSGNSHAVNDCGMRDIWPVLAKSVTFGYGSSGRFGFGSNRVQDRYFSVGHSGFFTDDFVRRYWLPYLVDGKITDGELVRASNPWWLSLLTVFKIRWAILVLLLLVLFSSCQK
jgi:pimeloyl-ACP methyl ester carboxylesterase